MENKETEKKLNSVLLGFGARIRKPSGNIYIKLYWGRIILAFLFLMAFLWFIAASGVYLFRKKEYPDISFTNIVFLPFRIQADRQYRGDMDIKKGIELFNTTGELIRQGASGNKVRDTLRMATLYLANGVGRSPQNLEGRIFYSQILNYYYNQKDNAAKILVDGVEFGKNDPTYIIQTFRMLMEINDMDTIKEMCEELIKISDNDTVKKRAEYYLANAYFLSGELKEAENLIKQKSNDPERIILYANILWERGEKQAAMAQLSTLASQLEQYFNRLRATPNADEKMRTSIMDTQSIIYGMMSKFAAELKDFNNAVFYARMASVLSPQNFNSAANVIFAFIQSGKRDEADKAIDDYFQRFSPSNMTAFSSEDQSRSKRAMISLSEVAIKTGDKNLATRIFEELIWSENTMDEGNIMLMATLINAKDYKSAIRLSKDIENEQPSWLNSQYKIDLSGLQAVAYYGANDFRSGDIYLRQFETISFLKIQAVTKTSKMLREIGAYDQAKTLLMRAYERNNQRKDLISELVLVDSHLGIIENLPNYINVLLSSARPSSEVMLQVYDSFSSDRCLFIPHRDELLQKLETFLIERKLI